ncbi:sodium:proton antiporter [Bryobacterales bacterium F-183]|nr:sodium:proton antiporter [Bryobacterales bacterium F-183]
MAELWFIIVGLLLIAVALTNTLVKRLPLSAAMLYIGAGIALGPAGVGMLRLETVEHAHILERLSEVAVIVSLFTAGLKLRLPLDDPRWRPALRLATVSMTITVALIALIGHALLGLPWGAGILLGAVLAPTDPVLASDVQVEHPHDHNHLRVSLTAEAGLNDGTAFPFVMLGLGLLAVHDLGAYGWRWVAVDLLWAISAGLAIGAIFGAGVSRFVLYLRRQHREALGLDDFIAGGLIALSYGLAVLAHSYGFLAVFAAGLAMRKVEMRDSGAEVPQLPTDASAAKETHQELAVHPEKAPAYMASALLAFNEQLERVAELAVVLVIGSLVRLDSMLDQPVWFVAVLFFLIRPIAVAIGLAGSPLERHEKGLTAWFGIRGIGSLYYLSYAITHGLSPELATRLSSLTLLVICASILVHGISVTPLMNRYRDAS